MDAVILAGGFGTRLKEVVPDVPKPLAPINGRPFLDILLHQLGRSGIIRKVILAVGYKAEVIQSRYSAIQNYSFGIEFSVEHVPMGTGGAICQALALTESTDVLVMNGDSYVEYDLDELARRHKENAAKVTMVVTEVDDARRFGSVKLDKSNSKILEFVEKTGSQGRGFVNAGCYMLMRSAFAGLPTVPCSFETAILPQYLGSIYALIAKGRFIDIGIPGSYHFAAEYLRGH
jgi:NDP-sugar pyrophosphorylase family protein